MRKVEAVHRRPLTSLVAGVTVAHGLEDYRAGTRGQTTISPSVALLTLALACSKGKHSMDERVDGYNKGESQIPIVFVLFADPDTRLKYY